VLGRQRTTMTTKAVVGGDAAFDLRGELSGIGETLRADLVGQLKNYRLPTTNPYADRYTAWVVERGRLAVDFHYRVEGDVITAEHDLKLGGLRVQRSSGSDEVKNRIGLPLGLIVGLLKDSRGDIDFQLPLKASLKDRAVDWADMVWGGIKQVVLKVLAGPFRAIGRAFRGGGEEETPDLNVTPVTFAAGSSVIGPEMETHLGRVADFLRRSPDIKMSLQPVATEADIESLKTQELTARIQTLQQERKIGEFPKAVAEYFKARNPDNAASTSTVEAQLTALRQAEPRPEQRLKELLDRRVGVARERLTQAAGIEPDRLTTKEPPPDVERSGQGRIEFTIGAE
jgi:Domain of Unknown Function (DUF748)